LDSELVYRDGSFHIEEQDRVLASFPYDDVRISVSWKALVFESAREMELYDAGQDKLSLEEVERLFLEDLARKGVPAEPPEDIRTDRRFMNALLKAYRKAPTAFEPLR